MSPSRGAVLALTQREAKDGRLKDLREARFFVSELLKRQAKDGRVLSHLVTQTTSYLPRP